MPVYISNASFKAVIDEKGAELTSLNNGSREYIWEGNPYYWGKHSPVLFPIVGTLANNSYTLNGKQYQMGRHGFARDQVFEVKEKGADFAVFSLIQNEETLAMYPFEFELLISYRLTSDVLDITYEVKNNSDAVMPFSLGAHPAFALHDNFENYALRFPEDESLLAHRLTNDLIGRQTQELLLENNNLNLDYRLFEDDAIILKSLKSDFVELSENNSGVLSVGFKDFPSLGLWTKPGAPFICIEPWQGYSDTLSTTNDITQKEGIRLLDIRDSAIFNIHISVAM